MNQNLNWHLSNVGHTARDMVFRWFHRFNSWRCGRCMGIYT
jgi:hypothetical protein